ncbi:MAG: alkaline phosphatase, partial [Pedobacter sp.]
MLKSVRYTKTTLILIAAILVVSTPLYAQQKYDVNRNAHSHNDYLQAQPFYTAHANRFASMEIDVYLIGDELYVAHDRKEIDSSKTIESLYIKPLLEQLRLNNGKPYKADGKLQFMIDFKTPGVPALKILEAKLKPIRKYFDTKDNPHAVRLVFSGSTPAPAQFKDFDEIFFFDGRPGVNYTKDQLSRIAFFSTALQDFTKWNGLGKIVEAEQLKISKFVDSVHALGKPVRLWGNPDTKTCWQAFIKMGIDYLNTDSPAEMAKFLNTYEANSY